MSFDTTIVFVGIFARKSGEKAIQSLIGFYLVMVLLSEFCTNDVIKFVLNFQILGTHLKHFLPRFDTSFLKLANICNI